MMVFREVKKSLIDILENSARNRFQVIGYQKVTDATESKGDNRTVQVFYSSSQFLKQGSRIKIFHDVTFRLHLIASSTAKVDLLAFEGVDATNEEKAVSLLQSTNAADESQESFDELVDIIFNIIMDARNLDLQLPTGTVSDRWVDSVTKDPMIYSEGQHVEVSGEMMVTARVYEEVKGDIGLSNDPVNDITLEINEDPIQETAVEVLLHET